MKVGVAELLSRNRRFSWLMATYYPIGIPRDVTSLASPT
jgi:hypothetical protein